MPQAFCFFWQAPGATQANSFRQAEEGGAVRSSNWILMFCQPHSVTSGQSNLGHMQYIYISTLCQVNLQNQSLRKCKIYIHKHQTQIFEVIVPSVLPLLKEHIKLGHAGIVDHSV